MKPTPEHQVMHVPRVGLKLRSGLGLAVVAAAARFAGVGLAAMVVARRAVRKSLVYLIFGFVVVALVVWVVFKVVEIMAE